MDKFGFIIHPLEITDYSRKYSWADKLPDYVLERVTRMLPALKVSHITGVESEATGKEIEGYFVSCFLTTRQMMSLPTDKVIKKIIHAGEKARELGAQIVGLGAFTSVVGDKGITVARELGIPVTTGNSYTVATAIKGTRLAAKKMGYQLTDITAAVVGATGSIGRAVSLVLSSDLERLILVGRDMGRLNQLKKEIEGLNYHLEINCTTDVKQAVSSSEVIISASGAVDALIDPVDLLPGAVVCDVARPRDVAVRVGTQRDDVLVIEGGIVEVPGAVNFNFNFGYPPKTAYACMAETMMLTLEGRFEDYSLGPFIEVEKVKETASMAEKHGFKLAGLRSFERALSDQKIAEIRQRAEEKMMMMY
ncbi:MAG: shikimate dehydrogenase [Firmicutes bacterium]|nr:shikimate dehydrogenase [Bacillota bacterium]